METCNQRALRRERRVWVRLEGRLCKAPLVWDTWVHLDVEDEVVDDDDNDGEVDNDDGDGTS